MNTNDCGFVLEMRNIRKTFGKLVANDNITLKVKKGTVHALIGENGAGKSTLMNILTGIHMPDFGEIWLDGEKMHFRNSLDAARSGIGMVYQEFMLFRDLTVFENIMYGFEEKTGIFINRKKHERKSKISVNAITLTFHLMKKSTIFRSLCFSR